MTTTLEALIVVKAYPNPSVSLTEAVCMLGVSKEHGFVRIYPVPFRDLESSKRFAKYQVVRMRVRAPKNDKRPNTFRPDSDSFEAIGEPLPTTDCWRARKEWVMPLISESMCSIQRQQEQSNTSMGFFKPAEVVDFTQEEQDDKEWSTADLSKLRQQDLFMTNQKTLLQKLPYKWRYKYRCGDPDCTGHHQQLIDWEAGALFFNIERQGITNPDEVHVHMKARFLEQICGEDKDLYFFTGNVAKFQHSFLILGTFWPPKNPQMELL